MSIEDSFTWNSPAGPLVTDMPMQAPDAPLAGVNGTTAENNHGYPPNHSHATHADGVPSAPVPNGYGDDTKGQG